jgi:hypothetical protein
VTDQEPEQLTLSDGSEPGPLLDPAEWAALYPSLSLTTIDLCLAEAQETARSRGIEGARSTVVIRWLVSARLQELSSRLER